MVKKRYTHIPTKKRAPLVENIDSFNQVRRNSCLSVINVEMPMSDQQARQLPSNGISPCMKAGNTLKMYQFATQEEGMAAAEAYCDRVEAHYRANGISYFDRKFNKMSYDLTKEEFASYDQKTSSTKDEEKTTVADEQETNPCISNDSKKAMVASSEVDPPISKDLSSFAAGDCPEVENVNNIDQVDSLKGEFHISFESEDSPDVVKNTDGSVKGEESMREGEAELRNAINKGVRRGFLLPKESKKAPDSKDADSLVLNDCTPSFETGDCPNVANSTSTVDSLLPKELHLSSSAADDYPEVTKTRDDPVNGKEDEEEWHDEDTHGSFNPADPKCKCAIS